MATYLRPSCLDDALAALALRPRTLLAGGTDHYPARAVRAPDEDVLDISGLPGFRTVAREGDAWRIPALARWGDVADAALPPLFDGLRAAARQVGGRQIQNAGTVLGNLCNASPAADGVPMLLAMDAAVEVRSLRGVRVVPLREFVLGNRRTALAADEMATAVLVPHREAESAFLKLGARAYLVISISMVALVLERDAAGVVRHAAAAVGACGPVAVRLPGLEAALLGRVPEPALVQASHLVPLRPIDDVRAPASYRMAATLELLRRAVAGFAVPMVKAGERAA